MHACPWCGMACDCDGEDTWNLPPDDCTCDCLDAEELDYYDLQQDLQKYADNLRSDDSWEFIVEWRGEDEGWWAFTAEPRHFNDEGEYLGIDFERACQGLDSLLA